MSQRSIRRAQQRALAAERRRETLKRRRAGLAAGAAIGATALFAPSAQAASFEVNTVADAAADGLCDANCTLRDAVELANANGEADTITFLSGLGSTIRLTQGQLAVSSSDDLTITGPGASALSITGDADDSGDSTGPDSRIFSFAGTGSGTISGLTLTEGNGSGGGGGAISTGTQSKLTVVDSEITASRAASTGGGGILANNALTLTRTTLTGNTATGPGGAVYYVGGGGAGLEVSHSTISGNTSSGHGAGIATESQNPSKYTYLAADLTVADSTISGNISAADGGGLGLHSDAGTAEVTKSEISGNDAATLGGGIAQMGKYSPLSVSDSTISGNDATQEGGGISKGGKYGPLHLAGSTISGNTAAAGGGVVLNPTSLPYATNSGAISEISGSTVSGNDTTGNGAGLYVPTLGDGERLTVSASTISGNDAAGTSFGGGVMLGGAGGSTIRGEFRTVDSTISGNSADSGAGVSIGTDCGCRSVSNSGSVDFDNSTIAANAAATHGGGLYLPAYDVGTPPVSSSATIPLTSTVVADNTAAGSPQDLDRADTSTTGGFDLAFSLVEAKGDAPLTESPAGSNIVGTDPQLGALANNGGPTKTHLPARTSPVVDKGNAPARLSTDQRGQPRTVDTDVANAAGGDGTDIGSVELDKPPAQPPPTTPPPPTDTTPTPPPPPPPPPPKRNLPPLAVIKTNGLRAEKDAARRVTGTAKDDHKVAKVEIALVSKSGGNCRDLLRNGSFSSPHRCGRPRAFITANGTTKWTFALTDRLKSGYYVIYARATDDAGRKQTSFGTKSRRPFRVR